MTTTVTRQAPEQVLYKVPVAMTVARPNGRTLLRASGTVPAPAAKAKPPGTAHLTWRHTHHDRRRQAHGAC